MKQVQKFPNIFEYKGKLYTLNSYPKLTHFEEKTVLQRGLEYREFRPERSKLAAAVMNKISQIGIRQASKVLYLGASHGYTPSFISDMVGRQGIIFGIDVAPQVVTRLYFVASRRNNIIPLLADCNKPETYHHRITQCDILYQDIAQRNQLEIFLKNMQFLKQGGFGILAIKAKSIDVTRQPRHIFREIKQSLEKTLVDYRELHPYEKDHALYVIKKQE